MVSAFCLAAEYKSELLNQVKENGMSWLAKIKPIMTHKFYESKNRKPQIIGIFSPC